MLELGLKGRVAIITGASDGLGRATAEKLAAEGCKVAICARRETHLREVAEAIAAATGAEVLAVPADVSKAADIERFVEAAVDRFGGVDIAVNNAGKSAAASLEEVDDEAWQEDLELKVMGAVRVCRLVVPIMRARGGGSIVNATIVGGKAPPARQLPTSVSRAAGINLTKSLANEYAADQIRVNTVCIGLAEERAMGPARRLAAGGGALPGAVGDRAARPHRRGGRVRRPGGLPGIRPGRLHHRDRDQPRRRHGGGRLTARRQPGRAGGAGPRRVAPPPRRRPAVGTGGKQRNACRNARGRPRPARPAARTRAGALE